MARSYWLNLFTGSTWDEFLKAGGKVSGFRKRRCKSVNKIKADDYFLCYITGLSRWIGLLEVTGEPYTDNKKTIWKDESFPCRLPVKVLIQLKPEHAVPVKDLRDDLSYFKNLTSPIGWTGHFRGCPVKEKPEDAKIVIEALKRAEQNPTVREYDKKLWERRPRTFEAKNGVVTVPESDDEVKPEPRPAISEVSHEEIQYMLLQLGADMGYHLWVARNDRNKSFRGKSFSQIPGLLKTLPSQFDDATNRTIELIDVLWLTGNTIEAAFEIEHTTSIYSGLLRMSDLLSMQPNLNIPLYIVAPDDRRNKVIDEINRPTFSRMNPPLNEQCQYIAYSALKEKIKHLAGLTQHLKPSFLDEIAEACLVEDA